MKIENKKSVHFWTKHTGHLERLSIEVSNYIKKVGQKLDKLDS